RAVASIPAPPCRSSDRNEEDGEEGGADSRPLSEVLRNGTGKPARRQAFPPAASRDAGSWAAAGKFARTPPHTLRKGCEKIMSTTGIGAWSSCGPPKKVGPRRAM